MTVTTATGAKLYIGGVRAAATDSAAEYAALTWTEVKEIESIGEFGDESSLINFASLSDGRQRKLKGVRDAGTLTVVVGRDPFDTGQRAMKDAETTKFEYAFKIEAADKLDANDTNTIYYFGGLVASQRDDYGGNDNVVRTRFNVPINTNIIEVVATVVP